MEHWRPWLVGMITAPADLNAQDDGHKGIRTQRNMGAKEYGRKGLWDKEMMDRGYHGL